MLLMLVEELLHYDNLSSMQVHRVSARQPYRASAKKATVMAAGGGKKVLMLGQCFCAIT